MDKKIYKIPLGFIVVAVLSIIPLISLLHPGIPLTHDGQDHVARIANFYNSLSEGNLVPRWAGNLNWGFGHPVLMFLYPLSSYFASAFHLLGFSFEDSFKLVMAFSYIFSGIFMYLWSREQFDENSSVVMSILYMYAPYRFVDIYVRGAIGEHLAFTFIPLLLFFIYKFFKKNNSPIIQYKYFSFLILSVFLLLLSHNAMSIVFLPVAITYGAILAYSNSSYKKFGYFIFSIVVGFMLSSFFILPAFFEGKYTLRDIVIGDEYKLRFVEPIRLLFSSWNYGISGQFSTEIGYLHILGILLIPFVLKKINRKKRNPQFFIALCMIFFFIISIFLTLAISSFFYQLVTVLKKFQFPWRFLSLTTLSSSVIGGMTLLVIKNKKIKTFLVIFIILFLAVVSYQKWQAKGYLARSDNFYSAIYNGTTDTGESAPIWSIRFMEKGFKNNSEIIEGTGMVQDITRSSTSHKYLVNASSNNVRVRENTIYFPGWNVYDNGVKLSEIEYQDPSNRGLITYNLKKGFHAIEIKFEDTKLRMLSNFISIFVVFFILILGIYIVKFKK